MNDSYTQKNPSKFATKSRVSAYIKNFTNCDSNIKLRAPAINTNNSEIFYDNELNSTKNATSKERKVT